MLLLYKLIFPLKGHKFQSKDKIIMSAPVHFSFLSRSSFETDGSNFSRCPDDESLSNDPYFLYSDISRNTKEMESVSQNLSAGQNKSQLYSTSDLRQNQTLNETLFGDCELRSESMYETENNVHFIQDKSSFSLFSEEGKECDLTQNESILEENGESVDCYVNDVTIIDLNYGRNDTVLNKKRGRPKKNMSKFRVDNNSNPKPQRSDNQRTKITVAILNSVVTVSTEIVKKHLNFDPKFLFKKVNVEFKKKYKKAKKKSEFRRVTIREILQKNVDLRILPRKTRGNLSNKEKEEALAHNKNEYKKITEKKIAEIEAFFDLSIEDFVKEYFCKLNELCPHFKENKTFFDVLLEKSQNTREILKNLVKMYLNLGC